MDCAMMVMIGMAPILNQHMQQRVCGAQIRVRIPRTFRGSFSPHTDCRARELAWHKPANREIGISRIVFARSNSFRGRLGLPRSVGRIVSGDGGLAGERRRNTIEAERFFEAGERAKAV